MKKIYQNFDGLDVTFQCAIPRNILNALKIAQAEAKETRKGVYTALGKNKASVEVADNGMRGGFAYRFDTGFDGAVWAIGDSDSPERWNVKVSVKSLMLALYGYWETKKRILDFLTEDLNAIPPENFDQPLERVSRFDYCVDFLAEQPFVPDPKCFIIPNRGKKKYQGQIPNLSPLDFICIDQGNDIQTITIGKMPNRQISIYNKRREIVVTKKLYWWKFWDINPEEIKFDIWRIEARAGKKELNKWNLRRFNDFENKAGDVVISILKDYRYVKPNENDKNRARWPLEYFWKEAIKAANNSLSEFICNADRGEIISGCEKEIKERYEALFAGASTSYAAVCGLDVSEMPRVLEGVRNSVIAKIRQNPQKFRKKFENSEKRFEFLQNK